MYLYLLLIPPGHDQEASLYIALAGQHQIWRHDIASGETRAFSGDGAERNANGSSARNTSWAQPSGLALSDGGDSLIVADSESSCIRKLSLHTGGSQVGLKVYCEGRHPMRPVKSAVA